MPRIPSPLPDELEQTISSTIGCLVRVHCELGAGLLESVYSRAVCVELTVAGIPYESEKRVPIYYRGELLCEHRLDILVDDRLILELKIGRPARAGVRGAAARLHASSEEEGGPAGELQRANSAARHSPVRAVTASPHSRHMSVDKCDRQSKMEFRVFVFSWLAFLGSNPFGGAFLHRLPLRFQLLQLHVAHAPA
jgi:hypothetical protein